MTTTMLAHRIARLDVLADLNDLRLDLALIDTDVAIECPGCDKTGDVNMADDLRPVIEALESVIDALEQITREVT